jgi:sporulation integral membrane protein YlbJ
MGSEGSVAMVNKIVSAAGGLLAVILLLVSSRRLRENGRLRKYGGTFFMAIVALLLTSSMVFYPDQAFESALAGLKVWWEVVFPALLPFFIFSEILMGLGVVSAMGVILEPMMRPLFNVPGVGSFVMAMGLASGYPIGAILTAKLRRQEACTQVEAERLLAFTNTADPLFMFGAVAVGMFGDAKLGIAIAIAHYLSSLSVGLIMRFYGRGQRTTPDPRRQGENIVVRAMKELYRARKKDARPIGQLLGDAVRQSVNSLLMIGGFIILFSVIIRVCTAIGLVGLMAGGISGLLKTLGLDPTLSNSIISGLFEITIGTQLCAQSFAPLMQKVAMAGAIIAWSGLSVHGQVASIVNDTDIRLKPYFTGRIVHSILAFVYTLLLWSRLEVLMTSYYVPAFLSTSPGSQTLTIMGSAAHAGARILLVFGLAVLISAVLGVLRRLRVVAWHVRSWF